MKRSVVVLIVVLLAVLGGGAYWWKSRSSGHDARAPDAAKAGAAATAAASAAKPAAKSESEAAPPSVALRFDDDPKGTLRLEGQVVDAEEHPVAGASVSIDSNPPRTVKSEGDGSFAFDGLLPRGYSLEARKDDGHAGPASVNVTVKTEPVTLRLGAGVTLQVTVQDAETKKPIARATVEERGLLRTLVSADEAGVARLRGMPAGAWVPVRVSAPGYGPVDELYQMPRQPGATDSHVVRLRKGVPVSGRVVDPSGKPVAGARVVATGGSTLAWATNTDPRLDGVASDAQGKWKLPAVSPGTWRFEATHEKHAPAASAAVTIEAGRAPAEVVITLEAAGSIAGAVHAADGKPVPYATVRVSASSPGWDFSRARSATADEQGKFSLTGLARKPLDVLAAHEAGSSEVTRLDLTTTPDLTNVVLTLSEGGAIAGVVVNASGQPVAEARVSAWPEEGSDTDDPGSTRWKLLGNLSDVADQAGTFRLSGLPKGSYRLRAMRSDASPMDPSTFQRKTEIAATGATNVKLVLENDGIVKGKVAFKNGSSPETFAVSPSAFGAPTPFSSKDGSFRLEGVAPGKRLFVVSGAGFARKTTDAFDIKAGVETDLGTITVERGRRVSGRVTRADGSGVAGAKVIAGNRFFGDGKEIMGANGPGGGMGVKEAETDANGQFVLDGLGVKSVLVVADAEEGRSKAVQVPPGEADVTLQLALVAAGVVEGKVTETDGKPVAGAIVVAQSQNAYRGQLMVSAGADGVYRFDRLGADTYLISGLRRQGMGGVDMETKLVTVQPGGVAHADIVLRTTDLSLNVTLETPDKAPVKNAVLFFLSGKHAIQHAPDIEAALSQLGSGAYQQGMQMGGKPQKFTNVTAGLYTLCALKLSDNPAEIETDLKDPDVLPLACRTVEVAAAPNEQSVTLLVPVAAPPPAPGGGK